MRCRRAIDGRLAGTESSLLLLLSFTAMSIKSAWRYTARGLVQLYSSIIKEYT